MFSWFISLLMVFGYHGKAANITSAGPDSIGNRHVAPHSDLQPSAADPASVDGGGGIGH